MEKIKVLQVVPTLSQANGVASYLSTYIKKIDKNKFEFSFLVLNNRDHGRYDEIINNGGKIVEIYREKNLFSYFKKIDSFFKDNHFDIVHCHVPNYGAIILTIAKKNNVKIRILHSHVNKSADKALKRFRNNLISPIAVKAANEYVACSSDAGKFLFGEKDFTVINNAIDVGEFVYNEEVRNEYRKKFNLDGQFVLGEFGRLVEQKNPLFTLDIFYEVKKLKENAILIFVGSGPLKEKIERKIDELHLNNDVILLDSRDDINKLYNVLDVFLLPSRYEGLGIVLIEAQANGLNCFASLRHVPEAANISELMHYVELDNNPKVWANNILKIDTNRKDVKNQISYYGYNIDEEYHKLEDFYINNYNKYKSERN